MTSGEIRFPCRLTVHARGLAEGRGDDVGAQPQVGVVSPVNVSHQHVHRAMVARLRQVQQLIKRLEN